MKKIIGLSKKVMLILMAITIAFTSTVVCFAADTSDTYSLTATENGIVCHLDGEQQYDIYLFVKYSDDMYLVDESDSSALLYYFGADGVGKAYTGVYGDKYYTDGAVSTFTGVYSGKYYISGVAATASADYYKVYENKIYKVSKNASASVYIKDSSKSGTYTMLVDGICYNINYKTGAASLYTGVYSGKYYKAGKLGTASKAYYKVYSGKVYKVNTNASASAYKKDTKKSGTYKMNIDSTLYTVNYKTGAATKFTGIYKEKLYTSGKLTNGWQTVSKKKYYCKSGVPVKGINKISGKTYYFDSKGVQYTGTGWKTVKKKKYYFVKGVAKTGWTLINRGMYHFNSSGVLSVSKKVDGIKVDSKGKATGPKKEYVMRYSKLLAKDITKPSNTKEKNLRLCFDYVIKTYKSNGNPRVPHYTKEDWIYVYAYDMFGERGGGNCFSYAAAFAFLAKQCGYEEVYACNSGGHGWVEIDGKVYDPEQYKDVGKKIYGWEYSNPKIKNYKGAISGKNKNPWMYVKIPG